MTTTEPMAEYRNGNCEVRLYPDGSKVREWDGIPSPDLPESIDLKITDYCDAGCRYCHEMSTKRGTHASKDAVLHIVDGLPKGAEVAIGGGDPLSHPDLVEILTGMRERGLAANLTVNSKHFPLAAARICELQGWGLVYGVGVSVTDVRRDFIWRQMFPMPRHLVYHVIAGIADPQSLIRHGRSIDRILVLGYKRFGFGLKCDEIEIEGGLSRWRYWIGTILRQCPSVSFDNLALRQLGVQGRLTPEAWARHYMGDDGRFTMYVDAVRGEYAVSSTSERQPIGDLKIGEMFRSLPGNQPDSPS